jgi:hypothetical protein
LYNKPVYNKVGEENWIHVAHVSPEVDSHECGNEHSSFVKGGEFLDLQSSS